MKNDSIIVLAWPEAMVAGANSWYDKYLSTKGKYRVGHAALILVNHAKEKLFYFDNGRYHTPAGFGSCLLYTSPSPRDVEESRMPSSA